MCGLIVVLGSGSHPHIHIVLSRVGGARTPAAKSKVTHRPEMHGLGKVRKAVAASVLGEERSVSSCVSAPEVRSTADTYSLYK